MFDAARSARRVLVVEDEYFIATDLQRELQANGWDVAGPVGSVAAALQVIADGPPDVAILDVNLDGSRSYAIADRLLSLSIPFMFVTGYDDWALPMPYRRALRITKPCTSDALRAALAQLCKIEVKA